jgi:transcriptional regulator with XRE-family HTH domain
MRASKLLQNRIGWHAARAGLADEALAVRAGISRSHLNRIKNGRAIPRVGTAIAIAAALGVPVAQLYLVRRG